ncbi:hypothetical protein U1Q18_029998 [Sarracenia purpurea var. burkii]
MASSVGSHGPHTPVLVRQGSVNSEEVESQLGNSGKPLNPTNLNDLVKNVFSPNEEALSLQNPSSSSPSPPTSIFLGNYNLNGTLNRKTVDEVWKEIVHQKHQLTVGKTTIENLLGPAGGSQTPLMAIDPMLVVSHQHADWMKFLPDSPRNFLGFENRESHLELPMTIMPTSSLDYQVGVRRNGSFTGEVMEKTIERRQKRMMKNRESAARSRARKQVGAGFS